jgi:hypothetical protein
MGIHAAPAPVQGTSRTGSIPSAAHNGTRQFQSIDVLEALDGLGFGKALNYSRYS